MIRHILVVCDGNICRSPVAERMLKNKVPEKIEVTSAGLVALVGQDIEPTARAVAGENGLECDIHRARLVTGDMCQWADVILVMERHQKERLTMQFPETSGKIMLIGHWLEDREVPDPFQQGRGAHEEAYRLLSEATDEWARRIE